MEFEKGLRQLWADERAIRQICLNLISNALKFTPRGGSITLTAGSTPDGGQTFVVKDTGPGIPKEEIPKVMQAFGQGSLAHQTAEGGTGLGLPIVQNLVTLHGGTFELRSELRKGTEAIVILPPSRVLRPMPPLQPLGAGAPSPAGRGAGTPRPRAVVAVEGQRSRPGIHSGNLGPAQRIATHRRSSYIHCQCRGLIPIFGFPPAPPWKRLVSMFV